MQARQRALSLRVQNRHRGGVGVHQVGGGGGTLAFRELIRNCQTIIDSVGIAFSNTTISLKRLQKILQALHKGASHDAPSVAEGAGIAEDNDDDIDDMLLLGGDDHVDTSEDRQYTGFRFPTKQSTTEVTAYIDGVERLLFQAWQESEVSTPATLAARRIIIMDLQLTQVEGGGLRVPALMRHLRLFSRFLQATDVAVSGSVSRWPAAHHNTAMGLILACIAEHITRTTPRQLEVIRDPASLLQKSPDFRAALRDAAASCSDRGV